MGVIRHEKENAQKGRANTQAFSLFSQICIDEKTIWPMAAASPQPTAGASPRLPPTGGASPRQPPCGAALPLPLRWHLALPAVWWQNHCQLSITTHSSPFFHGHYQKKGCKTFGVVSWVDVWPLEVGLSLATFFVLGYLYQHPQMINAHCTLEHVPPLLAGPADPLDSQPSTICHWKSVQESRRDYQGIWQANLLRHHYSTFPHTKQIS